MGYFSWLDCKSQKPIINGMVKKVYVLVPKKFREKFGVRISEMCYDGYGHFDGIDIYALVAYWNREHLSKDMLEKELDESQFGLAPWQIEHLKIKGKTDTEIEEHNKAIQKQDYDSYMHHRRELESLLNDYRASVMSMKELEERYGNDFMSDIGIAISCNDEQNNALPYPIKITYDGTAVYEDCKPSRSDEWQGERR